MALPQWPFHNIPTEEETNTGDLLIVLPRAAIEGELLLLSGGGDIDTPSGFTLYEEHAGSRSTHRLFYKPAVGGETSLAVVKQATSNEISYQLSALPARPGLSVAGGYIDGAAVETGDDTAGTVTVTSGAVNVRVTYVQGAGQADVASSSVADEYVIGVGPGGGAFADASSLVARRAVGTSAGATYTPQAGLLSGTISFAMCFTFPAPAVDVVFFH